MYVPDSVNHVFLKHLHASYTLHTSHAITIQIDGSGDVTSFDNIREVYLSLSLSLVAHSVKYCIGEFTEIVRLGKNNMSFVNFNTPNCKAKNYH